MPRNTLRAPRWLPRLVRRSGGVPLLAAAPEFGEECQSGGQHDLDDDGGLPPGCHRGRVPSYEPVQSLPRDKSREYLDREPTSRFMDLASRTELPDVR